MMKSLRNYLVCNHLFESCRPMFFITFIYGLTPFRIVKDGNGERHLKASYFGYFNTVLHVVVYAVCYVVTLLNHESVVGYFFRTEISNFADTIQIFNGLISATVIYMSAILRKAKLLKVMAISDEIDFRYQRLGVQIFYRKILIFSAVICFLMCSINAAYAYVSFHLLRSAGIYPSRALYVTFLLQHSVTSITISLLVCLMRSMQRRLCILHKNLLQGLTKPSDLYASFQTMFFVTFLFGLTSIHIKGPVGKRIVDEIRFGFIITVVHSMLFVLSFIWALLHNESIVGYFFQTELAKVGDLLQKFIGLTGMILLFLKFLINRKCLAAFVYQLGHIDDRFLDVGVAFNYCKASAFLNMRLIVTFIINISFVTLSIVGLLRRNDIYPSLAACSSFFSPQLFISVVTLMFTCFAVRIQERFDICVKVLKNLTYQLDDRKPPPSISKTRSFQLELESVSTFTIVTKCPAEVIQQSMEIHQLICEAASTANKYFTYQLLTIISISFLIIVFDAYYVLETLLGKSERESKFKTVEFVTFFTCQMVLYSIAIVAIVEGSSRVIRKSEKTAAVVHMLLNKATKAEVKEKLLQFSIQLIHLKVQFTAAGLFNIDRTLYFIISGAVTTYLIILLQFTSATPRAAAIVTTNNFLNYTEI